jgi:hypothetical protein
MHVSIRTFRILYMSESAIASCEFSVSTRTDSLASAFTNLSARGNIMKQFWPSSRQVAICASRHSLWSQSICFQSDTHNYKYTMSRPCAISFLFLWPKLLYSFREFNIHNITPHVASLNALRNIDVWRIVWAKPNLFCYLSTILAETWGQDNASKFTLSTWSFVRHFFHKNSVCSSRHICIIKRNFMLHLTYSVRIVDDAEVVHNVRLLGELKSPSQFLIIVKRDWNCIWEAIVFDLS